MSLGFARDSILNLQQLAHDAEDANGRPGGHGGSDEVAGFDPNGGNDDDGIGMFLDDGEEDIPVKSTMIPFPAPTPAPTPERAAAGEIASRIATPEAPKMQEGPNDKTSESPKKNKQYEGFTSDYAEYASYYQNDPYAVNYGGYGYVTQQGGEKKNIFCCLFAPWKGDDEFDSSSEESGEEARAERTTQAAVASGATAGALPTEVAYSPAREGKRAAADSATREEEKKAEDVETQIQGQVGGAKDKLAGDVAVGAGEEKDEEPASVKSTPPSAKKGHSVKKAVKGILKKKNSMLKTPSTDASRPDDSSVASGDHRRHMFPSYARETASSESKKTAKLNFASMARVVTITSRKDMAFVQKSQVWWQRTDYDDFKKTGRIIAKAMLQGGSEIWLTSNDAWGKKRASPSRPQLSRMASSDSGNEDEQDTEYERALHKYIGGLQQEAGEQPKESESSFGNKWWCKFGHSRRGLEHIASMEEGRQRQRNVNTATKAVMDEQRRQRANRTKDSHKLASIAHQYTSWARDLALAAGAADAEAVRVNFKSDAKCRSHYLVTGVKAPKESAAPSKFTDSKRYSFISGHIAAELLDANTSSTMKTKREEAKHRRPALVDDETEEAIHDPNAASEKMAKKAAGFAANEDEKVDMSAVLTGMGSVTVQG